MEKSKIDPAVLENGRLDRMEHHLKLMKESVERTNTEIHKISSALVGNEYTGGIGLVHKMDKLQKDISNTKDDIDILFQESIRLQDLVKSGAVIKDQDGKIRTEIVFSQGEIQANGKPLSQEGTAMLMTEAME